MKENQKLRLIKDIVIDYVNLATCNAKQLTSMTSMSKQALKYYEDHDALHPIMGGGYGIPKRYDLSEVMKLLVKQNLKYMDNGRIRFSATKYDEPASEIFQACNMLSPTEAYARLEMYTLALESKVRELEEELKKARGDSDAE